MSGAPQGDRFAYHGVPVETREQWAARQAAQAAAEARKAAEAEGRRIRVGDAERAAAARRERAAPQTGARWRRLGLIVVLVLAGGVVVGLDALRRGEANSPPNEVAATSVAPPATTPSPPPVKTRVEATAAPAPVAKGSPGESFVDVERELLGGLRGEQPWSAAPGIDPEAAGWWCVCYKTRDGADRTACRRLASECAALREMIQKEGSSSILRGSATPHACKFVRGAYPWIKLGRPDAWLPSVYSDAPHGDRQLRERRRAAQATVCAL